MNDMDVQEFISLSVTRHLTVTIGEDGPYHSLKTHTARIRFHYESHVRAFLLLFTLSAYFAFRRQDIVTTVSALAAGTVLRVLSTPET